MRQFVGEQRALRKDFNQWTVQAATKADVAELKAQLASLLPRETWDLYHKQVVEDVQQQTQRLTADEARIEKLQEKIHAMELDDANRLARVRLDAQQQVGQVAQTSAAGIAQTRSAFDEAINKALLIIMGALASGLIAAVIALANS